MVLPYDRKFSLKGKKTKTQFMCSYTTRLVTATYLGLLRPLVALQVKQLFQFSLNVSCFVHIFIEYTH